MKQKCAAMLAERGEFGDAYTFVALDAEHQLVPAYLVGRRTWNYPVVSTLRSLNRFVTMSEFREEAALLYLAVIHGRSLDNRNWVSNPVIPGGELG